MWKSGTTADDSTAQVSSLRSKVEALERDNEELVSINISLQEQLEAEKAKVLELSKQLLAEKKAQLAVLSEEESHLSDHRAILDLLRTQTRCIADLAAEQATQTQADDTPV